MSDEHEAGTLGQLLRPHLDALSASEPEPEPEPPAPPLHRLDEGELMRLIFDHLDDENPRVVTGIDFARLEVFIERPVIEPAVESPAEAPMPEFAAVIDAPRFEIDVDPTIWVGAGWGDDIPAVPAEWLDRPQLDDDQRELLARARDHALLQLNVRHCGRHEALRHVELFIHTCAARHIRLCRVVPGKGVESRGEPVLKRAVLEWCRGPGRAIVRGWAPELDPYGEWGSMVLLLRSPRRPTRS